MGGQQPGIVGPRARAARLLTAALLLGGLSLLLAWGSGGLSPSFIEPDESAHYVNALFIGDWLRAGLPSPLAFAEDYYQHSPKLSIGHWPPGWYALLSPVFTLARPTPFAAAILSAIIAGLPALLVLHVLHRHGYPRLGWAAALLYLLLPLVLEAKRHFLLDQPVTLLVGLGAIAWGAATARPNLPRFLLFGAAVAAAGLTKGNGLALALVPAIDILLGRRWQLLKDWRLWAAALATVAVIAPWYWISARISAGGFNHKPGLAYAWDALSANLETLGDNIPFAIGGVALGYAVLIGSPEGALRRTARLCLAVILAVLVFQSTIPVAIEPRYMAPTLPWAMILIALGARHAWSRGADLRREYKPLFEIVGALAVGLFVALVAARAAEVPPKTDIGAPALAGTIASRPGIWMVDGRAGGEGGVIAALAHRDEARRVWTARSSQWLSSSDFMGRGYRLTATSPEEVRDVLDRLGATGVVVVAERRRPAYPHSALLIQTVDGHPDWAVQRTRFVRGNGHVLVAMRRHAVRPNLEALTNRSANAAKLRGALN